MGFSLRDFDPTRHVKRSIATAKDPFNPDTIRDNLSGIAMTSSPTNNLGYQYYTGERDAQKAADAKRAKEAKAALELQQRMAQYGFNRPANQQGRQAIDTTFRPQVGGMMLPGTSEFNAYRDRAGLNAPLGAVSSDPTYLASRTPTRTEFSMPAFQSAASQQSRALQAEQTKQNALDYYNSRGIPVSNNSPLTARPINAPAPQGGMMSPGVK